MTLHLLFTAESRSSDSVILKFSCTLDLMEGIAKQTPAQPTPSSSGLTGLQCGLGMGFLEVPQLILGYSQVGEPGL